MTDWNPAANDIFLEALEIEVSAERDAFLEERCRNDQSLREQVESLLVASSQAGSFLDRPAIQPATEEPAAAAETMDIKPMVEKPGTVIGPYRLMEQIGEGGFGLVFVAEQQKPVRRRVALKVIKPGMDTKDVIARFEAERQALALMDHPNVARVLDGGTTDSLRPYFVMELVHGVPVTTYCDSRNLSTRARLQIFVDVCHAVQHAHQKGIIHRDLKPSNIMVTLHDGKPVPKVIDFGVSKALSQQLTEKTIYTSYGQMIGTPVYMSPEQAEVSGLGIDTRSDVYSLGVLLYELLTGRTPLDAKRLRETGYAEMLRVIREEEPPRPSIQISTLGEDSSIIATHRRTDPKKLSQSLRGELDWIVMKALEKDRNRRYETANGFAADVVRYLNDEPVEACPPSTFYRFSKLVRRNRGPVIAASLLLATLCLGLAGTVSGLVWAMQEAEDAYQARAGEARQKVDALRMAKAERIAKKELERAVYIHLMAEARHEAGDKRYGTVDELLTDCPDHLRGWEWWYLQRAQWGDQLLTLVGHGRSARDAVFSPDNRYLATVADDATARLWNADTGEQVRLFKGHKHWVWGVDISPDGKLLATSGLDQTVKLWHVATGNEFQTFALNQGNGRDVSFSEDGGRIATTLKEGGVWMIDLTTSKEKVFAHAGQTGCVAFNQQSTLLAAGDGRGVVKVWDLETGAERLSLSAHQEQMVAVVGFSPDGRQLLSGGWDAKINIWDVPSGSLLHTLSGHRGPVKGACYVGDGERIASVGHDGNVKLWDPQTGEETFSVKVGSEAGRIAVSPDGHRLAACWLDKTVTVLNAGPKQEAGPSMVAAWETDEPNWGVAFRHDGNQLAAVTQSGTARLWDVATEKLVHAPWKLGGGTSSATCNGISPDGTMVAAAGDGGSGFSVWDTATGKAIHEKPFNVAIYDLAFSPDSQVLATAMIWGGIELWNPRTGELLAQLREGGWTMAIAFSPDGKTIASGNRDKKLRRWDVATGKMIGEPLTGHAGSIWSVGFSPNGKMIATAGSGDATVRLWDPTTGEEIRTLDNHYDQGMSVAFSPDSKYVAASSGSNRKGRIVIWEAASGALLSVISGHDMLVTEIAFSADGRLLASSSIDKTVKLWDVSELRE